MIDYAVRVTQPGTWVDGTPDQAQKAHALITELVSQMVNANIGLNLFNDAQAEAHAAMQAHQAAMHAHMAAMRLHQGSWPAMPRPTNRLITARPVLCAHMFVFSLDQIRLTLRGSGSVSGGVAALESNFSKQLFPGLKGARDSAHHRDQRAKGLDKYNKPIIPKAVHIPGAIDAVAGSAMMIDNLVGTKFTCTDAFGDVVEVDVSLPSLQKVQMVVQTAINVFPKWKGPSRSLPD